MFPCPEGLLILYPNLCHRLLTLSAFCGVCLLLSLILPLFLSALCQDDHQKNDHCQSRAACDDQRNQRAVISCLD